MSETLLVPADIYDEALQFCNARRAEKSLEPITELPAGYSWKADSCPCAQSTPGLTVSTLGWQFEDESYHGVGSPVRFIKFFDEYAKYTILTLPVRKETTNV